MLYRLQQFYSALYPKISAEDESFVQDLLTSEEIAIFNKLPKADRKHSLRVAYYLLNLHPNDHNLIKAGLLHDIGKTVRPLNIIEKSLAVLLHRFFPNTYTYLTGKENSYIYIYNRHAQLGYEIAARLKLDEDILFLIKHHHEKSNSEIRLQALIDADNTF